MCLEYENKNPFVVWKIIGGDSKKCKLHSQLLDLIEEFKRNPCIFQRTYFFDDDLKEDFDEDEEYSQSDSDSNGENEYEDSDSDNDLLENDDDSDEDNSVCYPPGL